MNIGTRLIAILLLLCTSQANASKNTPVLIGYAEIPAIHEPMWHELISQGGTRLAGDTTQVTLYSTPNDWQSAVLVIDDFSNLYAEHISHYDSLKAQVYAKVPGWYQVRTLDERHLWIPETDTRHFISYLDALGSMAFLSSSENLLRANPSNDAEFIEYYDSYPGIDSFTVLEVRTVNGELWLKLKYEWYVLIHEDSGISPLDERFEQSGWVKAHDQNGEPTFWMLGPMC